MEGQPSQEFHEKAKEAEEEKVQLAPVMAELVVLETVYLLAFFHSFLTLLWNKKKFIRQLTIYILV